jgi:hypothetical protein
MIVVSHLFSGSMLVIFLTGLTAAVFHLLVRMHCSLLFLFAKYGWPGWGSSTCRFSTCSRHLLTLKDKMIQSTEWSPLSWKILFYYFLTITLLHFDMVDNFSWVVGILMEGKKISFKLHASRWAKIFQEIQY